MNLRRSDTERRISIGEMRCICGKKLVRVSANSDDRPSLQTRTTVRVCRLGRPSESGLGRLGRPGCSVRAGLCRQGIRLGIRCRVRCSVRRPFRCRIGCIQWAASEVTAVTQKLGREGGRVEEGESERPRHDSGPAGERTGSRLPDSRRNRSGRPPPSSIRCPARGRRRPAGSGPAAAAAALAVISGAARRRFWRRVVVDTDR